MEIIRSCSTVHTTLKAGRQIEYIVIHYTAGVTSRGGTAANTAAYYNTTSTQVSSDFIVDDKTVVQYNPDIKNRYTWHCGGTYYGNKGGTFYRICSNVNSIGVEICSTNSTGKMTNPNDAYYSFTDAAVANAVLLTRQLMQEYNIPAEKVIRHYDVTGKLCPGIVGWNAESGSEKEWEKFKSRLTGKTESGGKLYRVQVGAFGNRENAEKYLKTVQKYFPDAFLKEGD